MLKLIGAVLIFIATAYCGFYFSDRLKRRRDFLRAMSQALSFILSEIEFGHYELTNIFRRADASPALFGFFKACGNKIEQDGIRRAWERTITQFRETVPLKDEDTDTLMQLGTQIGMSDVRGQKSAICRTITQLDSYASLAEDEYMRLGKPYRSCGILLGVFFLIIIV